MKRREFLLTSAVAVLFPTLVESAVEPVFRPGLRIMPDAKRHGDTWYLVVNHPHCWAEYNDTVWVGRGSEITVYNKPAFVYYVDQSSRLTAHVFR